MADAPDVEAVAEVFRRFAREECDGSSPLYADLSRDVAEEPALLKLAASARTPIPNLFFAAVHFLVIREPSASLAAFYPSVVERPRPVDEAWPAFRAFVHDRRSRIRDLLTTRLVQTNEVRRCGYLLPAFNLVFRRGGGRPLALIEVGCSAGLLLLIDHYRVAYDDGVVCGDDAAGVRFEVAVEGPCPSVLRSSFPRIASRTGVDLNPISANDPEGVAWLRALIWPEHHDRRRLLDAALRVALETPAELHRRPGEDLLPGLLKDVPDDVVPCVFQTATINQFAPDAVKKLRTGLREAGSERPVFFVSRAGALTLERFCGDGRERVDLAECDGHGRWFRWIAK